MSSNKIHNQGHESITDPCIAELFEGKNVVFLATLMEDSSSQVTSTWVDIDKSNNTILISAAKGRIKYRNGSKDK